MRAAAAPPIAASAWSIAPCSIPTMRISCRNCGSTTRRVKTNTVSNTAFRGFGGPQGMMAIERVIDTIAWSLGRDPLDMRKANLYGPGRDLTPYGQTVEDCDVAPVLIEQFERSSDYRAAAEGDRRFQRPLADPQARHRADAGEVRHFVYAHPSQSGRRAGACLSGRLRAPQSWRHGNGPGPVPEGRAGGGGGIRHRARARAHHRDLDRQGAEHVGDGGVVRHRSQRHGGAAGRPRDQGAAHAVRQRDLERRRGSDLVPRRSRLHRQRERSVR